MSAHANVHLTEPAKKRLASLLETYRGEILEVVENDKFVPGEDVTEATAGDIETAFRQLRQGRTRRVEVQKLYAQMFLFLGALSVVAGIMYPSFEKILGNPVQMILLFAGLYIGFGGLFLYRRIAARYPERAGENQAVLERVATLERLLHEVKVSAGSRNIGEKPGKGRYCCSTCDWRVTLDDDADQLPPCGNCARGQATTYVRC